MPFSIPDHPVECRVVLAAVDMVDFRSRSAAMADMEVFRRLDRFYSLITTAVEEEGGVVVKFMGDAALILFEPAASRAALGALRRIARESRSLFDEGEDTELVTIRAHVGSAAIGPIGPEQRPDVIGSAVNELFTLRGDGPQILSDSFRRELDLYDG